MPQDPRILPIGPFLPDQPALNNPGITKAQNCVPQSPTSYGPLTDIASIGLPPIPGTIFGLFYFLDKDQGNHIFVGTDTKLWHLDAQDGVFVDASNLSVQYSASIDQPWTFTSYGETIIAVNGGNVPQAFTIGDLVFSNLSATAPFALYAATVRDFLVLVNVTELTDSVHYPQRVHWSAIGSSGFFPTLGTNAAAEVLSDAQDLRSDLGVCRGIAANLQSADMAIFLDQGVYAGFFTGSPTTWSFQTVQGAVGCKVPTSIISHRGIAYYLGLDGFYQLDGVTPKPIGTQQVDDFFFHDPVDGIDPGYLHNVLASAVPVDKLIIWLYNGRASGGVYNRALIYNFSLDRWSSARISAQWMGRGASMGYTLDQLDQFGNLDTLQFSLDSSVWVGGVPGLFFIDPAGNLAHFGDVNLEATIDTMEMAPFPANRCMVTNSWPLVDGAQASVSLGSRNSLSEPIEFGPSVSMNSYGSCLQRKNARFFRSRITIPAGQRWTHCEGVRLDVKATTPR